MFMENKTKVLSKLNRDITIFGCGLSIGILLMYFMVALNVIKPERMKYVYVDVEQIIASVNQNLSQKLEAKQITEEQIDEKLIAAKTQFNIILDEYSIKNNAIVISSHKVIAGAQNVTEYFAAEILAGIK